MENYPRARARTPKKPWSHGATIAFCLAVVVGPMVLIVGLGAVLGSSSSTERAAAASSQEQTAPAPMPVAAVPNLAQTDEAMRYLYGIRVAYLATQRTCDQAAACRIVAPTQLETGAVASVRDVAPCLQQRLEGCRQSVAYVESHPAPASIADMWSGVLDMHLRGPLELAKITADMVAARRRLRVPGRFERESVLDEMPDTDPFNRRVLDAMGKRQAGSRKWNELSDWLKQRGACVGAALPDACGLATILWDDPEKVGARYASWYTLPIKNPQRAEAAPIRPAQQAEVAPSRATTKRGSHGLLSRGAFHEFAAACDRSSARELTENRGLKRFMCATERKKGMPVMHILTLDGEPDDLHEAALMVVFEPQVEGATLRAIERGAAFFEAASGIPFKDLAPKGWLTKIVETSTNEVTFERGDLRFKIDQDARIKTLAWSIAVVR